jgi:hypothetical protein
VKHRPIQSRGADGVGIPKSPANFAAVAEDDDRRFILETLRQEAMELLSQQRAIAERGARALAFGGTVLAGFAAYGVAGKTPGHELLLRALPVALGLIAIELLQNFATEGAIAKAREKIETALSDDMRVTVLVYDRYVRNRRGVNLIAVVVGVAFLLLYLLVIGLTQIPGPPQHSIGSASDVVWAARGATFVTFAALVVVATGVYLQPRWVEEKFDEEPITLAPASRGSGRVADGVDRKR